MFKYIIFEDEQANQHLRIFDALWESHVNIRNDAPSSWKVIGAGEFRCPIDDISCVSKSPSLARPFSAEGSIVDIDRIRRLYNAGT